MAATGNGRAADGAERQWHSLDAIGNATAGQSMAGSSRGIAMTRDDTQRKRTDTPSQGIETRREETDHRGMALHRMAAALDGYDQRRQAKGCKGQAADATQWHRVEGREKQRHGSEMYGIGCKAMAQQRSAATSTATQGLCADWISNGNEQQRRVSQRR